MADGTGARVVVVGAGFAGLRAVRRLARAGVAVRWIDGRNYHTFLPLLYQVATAGLEPQAIVYPVRSFTHRLPNVEYVYGQVTGMDPAARTVTTDGGRTIAYDWLLVAAGGTAADFGIPGVRAHTFQLYDLEDARALRNHVLRTLERAATTDDPHRRAALLTIVLVGAGPTGVEMAGALAEFRRHVVPRDYPSLGAEALRVVLLEAGPEVLPSFAPDLRARALRDLRAFGVDVRLSTRVDRVTAGGVHLGGGEEIATTTAVWCAGIRAAPLAATLGLPTGRAGRLVVEPTLQVPGHPRVYAAGDIALVQGAERLPQVAQVAIQQGGHAATNILHAIAGEPLVPFAYRDKGAMATIGRSRAVVQIGRLHLTGWIAWWSWLVVHIVMLIGFRNRLVVLVNWAWNYVTYDRGLRAIVGDRPPVRDTPDAVDVNGDGSRRPASPGL